MPGSVVPLAMFFRETTPYVGGGPSHTSCKGYEVLVCASVLVFEEDNIRWVVFAIWGGWCQF